METNTLLLVDFQNDFTDKRGSLYVDGGEACARNAANFLNSMQKKLSTVYATMDWHKTVSIFHPNFWVDKDGNHPKPFTRVLPEKVESGEWRAANPEWDRQARYYAKEIFKISSVWGIDIWPVHCVQGSWGASIYGELQASLQAWERITCKNPELFMKGKSRFTEQYGVFKPVSNIEGLGSGFNGYLAANLAKADNIYVAGLALSHCVADSVYQLADYLDPKNIQKIVLLEDCTASVPGFEALGEKFITDMTQRGMRIAKSTDF